ncbi:holo-ACP synthase [Nitratifractor salsuginis]|uniref:Holo-[acyl-carrier-protein] synthase n=1 Tax=Nitratifractor salsuginis (strain DSM 16511 / JCM 12458 / E9I37-1) TaxID=749222 RepID=E6X0G6_NITSE|nr:holo-ACP synthase [Nitratifractor salsuginis]ADV46816.1 holo-acyl-carrier-protein synthase [Nitratifractor salsuginis DSM 16511]
MIKVGTDIALIERITKSREKFGERFLKRYLDESEYDADSTDATLAGLWAAKEATAKALGCGIGADLGFHDMHIVKDERGAPHLLFDEAVTRRFGIVESSLSISHDGGFAIAVVMIVTE